MSCAQHLLITPFSDDHLRRRRQQQQVSLLHAIPLIHVRSFASTTTDDASTTTKSSSAPTSTTPRGLRQRATAIRQSAVKGVGRIRDSASNQIQHIRDDPGGAAKGAGAMMRQYGPVFVGTYASVYFSVLFLLFTGVETGILDPVSLLTQLGMVPQENATTVSVVLSVFEKYSFTQNFVPYVKQYPALANLAVAWIAIKFTEPVRLPTALFLTPYVARLIGWTGGKKKGAQEGKKKKES